MKRLKNTKHCWEPIIRVVPHLFRRYELVKEEFREGKLFKQYYEYEQNTPPSSENVEDVKNNIINELPSSPSEVVHGLMSNKQISPRTSKESETNESYETYINVAPSTDNQCSMKSSESPPKANANDGWILLPPKENSPVGTSANLSVGSSTSPLAPRYSARIARLVQACPNCMFMIRSGDCIIRRSKDCWEHAVCPDANML